VTDLIDAPITDRDWQARAWDRLHDVRARNTGWTLDQALAHRTIGPVVRGYAAQLKRDHAAEQAIQEREAKFGRRMVWNGYGMKPRKPLSR
jgi:hypothetical protein